MAVELGLSDSRNRGLEPRHHSERRIGNRRTYTRETSERRRRDRRLNKLRNVVLTSLALAMPNQLRSNEIKTAPSFPRVSTTIDSVEAIAPEKAYEGIIREASGLYRVDASLIRSVMQAESGFDARAVSRAGAKGLMQLMPDIAAAFGVVDPFDPRENIMAGTRLLRELLDQHRGNLKLAIASYNAGPTAVARYGAVPPFKETRKYVKKVTGLIADARDESNNND
jgi:soluble lytic murein transglycosylase-like protein